MFGVLRDIVDQVLRHGGAQALAAHQHDHAFRVAGEIHCGLAGGIGAADDVDILIPAGDRLGRARSVIYACALQAFDAGHIQLAPLHPGRDHHRVA